MSQKGNKAQETLDARLTALVFCSAAPVTEETLLAAAQTAKGPALTLADVQHSLQRLSAKYAHTGFALVRTGGGYQFLTEARFHENVAALLRQQYKQRMSAAALETLAIIAYRQPVSRVDIEAIRGVRVQYLLGKLLDKGLIRMTQPPKNQIGRSLCYQTTPLFLDCFGLNALSELPKMDTLDPDEWDTGEAPKPPDNPSSKPKEAAP